MNHQGGASRTGMHNYLDFEKPVADLEGQILELKKIATIAEALIIRMISLA